MMNENENSRLINPAFDIDYSNGEIKGKNVINSEKRLKDIIDIFEDKQAILDEDINKIIYRVEAIFPVEEGVEGGLFYGRTEIEAGTIGKEYYITYKFYKFIR